MFVKGIPLLECLACQQCLPSVMNGLPIAVDAAEVEIDVEYEEQWTVVLEIPVMGECKCIRHRQDHSRPQSAIAGDAVP